MKIGYVCTNYNNSHFSVGAARSLLENSGHDISIVVVDNASSASEQEALRILKADRPQVEVIFSPENVGYFTGLNLGIAHLRRTQPEVEWAVVGNNDLEFPPDFCDKVERNIGAWRDYSVVSPDIVTADGEHQNPHVISNISKTRELFYDIYYSNYHLGLLVHALAKKFKKLSDRKDEQSWPIAQPIYQGHGSCYLLTPQFFERFTELWAPTFMMSEEYFLSKQLSDRGEQVYYDPAIQVLHHWHASLDTLHSRRRWELARDGHREYRKYVKILG